MKEIGIAVIIMLAVLMISGCVSSDSQPTAQTTYEKHILVCPNPDCPLHDPNGRLYFTGNAARGLRPIDCEPYSKVNGDTSGFHYLCQVCGEEWDVKV